MMKIKKFQRYANEFYMSYHFKLKTELNLKEFLAYFRDFTDKPFQKAYKVAQRRRNGFSMDVPKGEIKRIVDEQERKERKTKRTLIKLFNEYDENKDGKIDLKELKTSLDGFVTCKGIDEVFQEYDQDHNGIIDFEEFMNMFKPSSKTFDGRKKESG